MKVRTLILAFVMVIMGAVFVSAPSFAVTCPAGTVRGDAGQDAETLAECNTKKDESLMPTVNNIINVALGVLGLIAILVIIYGGFTYIMSVGDAAKIKKAKDTIIGGIVGLIVALLAFAIINFVVSSLGNGGGGDDDDEDGGEEESSLMIYLG